MNDKYKEAPGHLWQCRVEQENKSSYDIPHKVRLYTYGAYAFGKFKDEPFNLLLRFEFKRKGDKSDVLKVRELAQFVRVQLANMKIPCNLIWSRFVEWHSDMEEVCLLTHVTPNKMKDFIELARGWIDGLDAYIVGYGEDYEYNGANHNVLDYMLRAANNESLCKDPSILCEQSDKVYGYRVWSSWNLKPKHRRDVNQCPESDELIG